MAEKKPRRTMADVLAEQRAKLGEPPAAVPEVTFQAPEPTTPVLTGVVVDRPALPEPHDPLGDGELTDLERKELEVCEAAIRDAQKSFIARGRALHVIRDGRLYRQTHRTFDDFLVDWDMDRKDASRDILTYRLGERLSQICDKINRDQVLKLKPIEDRFGEAAAVTVYETVAEVKDGKVTAALLRGAVDVLPEDEWDEKQAVERIRAYLAGELAPGHPSAEVERFTVNLNRVRTALRKIAAPDVVRAVAQENPAAVKEFAEELRRLADEMDNAGE